MIQTLRDSDRQLKVRPSERLKNHFISLARRLNSWRQQIDVDSTGGVAVGITSAEEKCGRTVVSFNLASALAKLGHGSILFVETSMNATGFSRKVPRPAYGFSELLSGEKSPAECIVRTSVDNLFVMPPGQQARSAGLSLPVEAMNSIIPELANTFDYIVFDLPIAEETTLCFPVAEFLDGILIVNSPSIHESKIHRLAKRFRDMNKKVIGLVLNKA